MTQFRLSTLAWKWLISALALFASILLVIEVSHAIKPSLIDGRHGSLGAFVTDQNGTGRDGQGTHFLRIESLVPDSPLLAAGARVGDKLKYDSHENRWRKPEVGEHIGLTLFQASGERHIAVAAMAVPIPFFEYFDYWARCLLAVPALLFSLLIGFKQPEARAYRALAMTFIGLSLMVYFPFNYSPLGVAFTASKLANMAAYGLLWYWCVVFALHYQPYEQTGFRLWLTRSLPWYRALVVATTGYALWFGLGHEAPLLAPATLAPIICGMTIAISSLVNGWRRTSGEIRQRHLWMLLSFAFGTVPALLTVIPSLNATIRGLPVTIMLFFIGQMVMYSGLAYAVLKHRVFNFDFAISRALVFSVVSILLLCGFGMIEWIYHSLMHGGGNVDGARNASLILDAALALAAYLVFHKVHGTLERWVERFFFDKWHQNEHKLRQYVRQAAHITAVDALLESLRTALDRFTGQAGCAIYLKQENGEFTLATATLEHAPPVVEPDNGIAVQLRTELSPLVFDRLHSGLPGELALPMSHRGALNGVIILGTKRRGESYRPDECEVLGFTAHQIGLDLHALRVEVLEGELRSLARKAEQQSNELKLMAGRRKKARESAGSDLSEIMYVEGQV